MEENVKWGVDMLERTRYKRIQLIPKSDQESRIVALKTAIAIRRKAATVCIESPALESQSNATIVRPIRSWRGNA